MAQKRSSLKPLEGANRSLRRKLGLKRELMLVLTPTVTVLLVLALVEFYHSPLAREDIYKSSESIHRE